MTRSTGLFRSTACSARNRRRRKVAFDRTRRLAAESLEHRRLLAGDSLAWHNAEMPLDVTGDHRVTSLDALHVIADLNALGPRQSDGSSRSDKVDTNGDGSVTSRDVLLIFDALNKAEGEEHEKVRMRLEVTAPGSNDPITTIEPDSDFVLRAYVEDITGRAANVGVFAAYLDVTYTADLADIAGEIEFGSAYPNGQTGEIGDDGLINEVGAFAASFDPIGPGEVLLFSVAMRTEAGTGTLTFMGDPADELPASETLVYFGPGEDPGVAIDEIEFVGTSLQVARAGGDLAAVDDIYDGIEDEALVVAANGVLGNDRSGDIEAVKLSDPTNGTVDLQPDGSFVYTPDPDFNGTDSFTYAASRGAETSDPATVTLNIAPVNDPPVALGETFTTPVNTTLLRLPEEGLLVNDIDIDSPTLSVVIPLASTATNGVVSVTPEGAFSYVPLQGFVGTDSFDYFVTDGLARSERVTAAINVGDESPLAADDSYETDEDLSLNVDAAAGVLANDDLTALFVTLVDGTTNGTLTLREDGAFTYEPVTDFNGTDTFTYTASNGVVTSNLATVLITVRPQADAPRTTNDIYSTRENTPLIVPAAGVLANDVDPDGDAITALRLTNTENGTVELNSDGSFTYTPNSGFVGTDTFTYVAQDGVLTSPIPGTVSISVTTDQNIAPEANDDQYRVIAGQPLTVGAGTGVLANDTDVNGDVLGVQEIVRAPENGAVEINSDGSFTYTPNDGFIGTDSFSYTVTDGFDTSEPATVELIVGEEGTLVGIRVRVTDAAGNELSTLTSGDNFQLRVFVEDLSIESPEGVFAAFTDVTFDSALALVTGAVVPGSNYTNGASGNTSAPGLIDEAGGFDVISLGPGEFLLFSVPMRARGAGTLTFTTDPADQLPEGDVLLFNRPDAIPTDQIDYGTASVLVNPLARPIAIDDTYNTDDGGPLSVSAELGVLSNDLGTIGALEAELDSDPENGSLILNADGSFVYTPDAGFAGADGFSYLARSVEDGTVSDVANVTIAVGDLTPGSISGSIYFDVNNNGRRDSYGSERERGFGGVIVTLSGTNLFGDEVSDSRITDKNGDYEFSGLLRGQYTVIQEQPGVVIDGIDSGEGSTNDEIVVDLSAATNLDGINFGERGLMPGFYGIPNFFASRMPGGASVAMRPDGTVSWFGLDDGWSQFASVTLNLSSDGSRVTITATDENGTVFVGTAATSNSNVAVFGNSSDGILIQFLDPSSAYSLQAVARPSAGAIDAAFASIF